MSRNDQLNYWNTVANEKKFTLPIPMHLISNHLEWNASILDVGCGYGRTLNELVLEGFEQLIGVDFSSKMIERGKSLYPELDLKTLKTPALPFPDESFDAVILFAVLTCIESNEEQIALLSEIHRVLKPAGIVLISDFLLNTDPRNLDRYKKYQDIFEQYGTFKLPNGGVCRHHTLDWVRESTSTFQEISLETIQYTTMNGNPSNGYSYIGRK
ncbi:hypothetical protein SANA_06550 [Gottschalkiaceae bacterium SANA]|nr:hypothetical protein SANA_06550 [Gottschalkiaceae bacterium SANA]